MTWVQRPGATSSSVPAQVTGFQRRSHLKTSNQRELSSAAIVALSTGSWLLPSRLVSPLDMGAAHSEHNLFTELWLWSMVHSNIRNEHGFIDFNQHTCHSKYSAGENCLEFNASFYQFELAGYTLMI